MAAPKTTNPETKTSTTEVRSEDTARRVFIMAALNMSWQLAFAVLIPVVGGYKLDQKWGSLPLATIVGLGVAMALVMIILHRQLKMVDPNYGSGDKK